MRDVYKNYDGEEVYRVLEKIELTPQAIDTLIKMAMEW